jgi:hypothetical protein
LAIPASTTGTPLTGVHTAPPVSAVGPGALGDPAPFLAQLAAGLEVHFETETIEFTFEDFASAWEALDFASAWEALAGVTASQLEPEQLERAKTAVRKMMWPNGDGSRCFRNDTHFIVGLRR